MVEEDNRVLEKLREENEQLEVKFKKLQTMFGDFKVTYESEHETIVDKLARYKKDIASKLDAEYFDEEIDTITEMVDALGKLTEGQQVNEKILSGFAEARQ